MGTESMGTESMRTEPEGGGSMEGTRGRSGAACPSPLWGRARVLKRKWEETELAAKTASRP